MINQTMMQDERIAVVIPVYNGALYLAEAIESALRQTLPPHEIVVIDDGSKDNSVEVARRFPSVRLIVQANAGVSASRNRGVAETESPWIAFLDQDDVWEPEKLAEQMKTIRAVPETDVCLTGKRNLSQTRAGFVLGEVELPPESSQIGPMLYDKLRFVPSCVMIRRSAYLAVGGFDRTASPCEDWDLWLRLEQNGARFTVCSLPLMQYRYHAANASNDGMKMYHGELRVFDRSIGPRFPAAVRGVMRQKAKSRFMAGVALVDRESGLPHVKNMLMSLAWFPFGDWRRYKVAAQMVLTQSGVLPKKTA